jgi:ferritin-like metal-binding protein YciE
METLNNLLDLLVYQVQNLYRAEEQMQQTMPQIMEKAIHTSLKNALHHHWQLTDEQKNRLQQVMQLLNEKTGRQVELTAGSNDQSKGMAGLLEELNEVLACNISNEVNDAAIIAYVQKIEHYEITTYGTAHAFAEQIHLHAVAALLNETLTEEYDADDLLTALATAALNKESIPEEFKDESKDETSASVSDVVSRPAKVSISERTVNSPGGRAGTSHRRYGSGESRGH